MVISCSTQSYYSDLFYSDLAMYSWLFITRSLLYHKKMTDVPGPRQLPEGQIAADQWISCAPPLSLLVELEPRHRAFFDHVRDLLQAGELQLDLSSTPGAFWPDVFVERGLPWRRFLESAAYHILALALLLGATRFFALQPRVMPRSTFHHAEVIYYSPAEYLPQLDTRHSNRSGQRKADPEYSRQPVISVPREADNGVQTIVTPAAIRLKRNIPLPNIVAWSERPRLPIAPAPAVPVANLARGTQRLDNSVVAPPPDAARVSHSRDIPLIDTSIVAPPPDVRSLSRKNNPKGPQPTVIEPPPGVDGASIRQLGEVNIGHTAVIAPLPQLPLAEQRTTRERATGTASVASITPQVVPPAPTLPASGSSNVGGRMIALNLRPSIGAPPDLPDGNRRGSFAATPQGHSGASGTPGASSANPSTATDGRGNGIGKEIGSASNRTSSDLPSGLYVGKPDQPKTPSIGAVAGNSVARNSFPSASVNPKLIGSVPPPHLSTSTVNPLHPDDESKLSEAEREIFGDRKFYSLTLNMPNLNSAGGSWVVRFAELKQNANAGEISAPAATRKVDPAYPIELMRQNVAGTVTLYAVIHADGKIGSVRVLRGIDDRLDHYASEALGRWQFQPATRNGDPVDVEAVFRIPFRPARVKSGF
jgi:TonB family protein